MSGKQHLSAIFTGFLFAMVQLYAENSQINANDLRNLAFIAGALGGFAIGLFWRDK